MKIVTPERDAVVEVAEPEVSNYLAQRGLATVRSGVAGTLVAFPEAARDLVEKALAGTLPSVTYHGLDQLGRDVATALESAEVVALVAGKHLMREFFSTGGFCTLVRRVTSGLSGVELAVPPGAYADHKHVAVWRRAASMPT